MSCQEIFMTEAVGTPSLSCPAKQGPHLQQKIGKLLLS